MSSVLKYRDKWRAHIYVDGVRESRLCRTRNEAMRWADQREEELRCGAAGGLVPFRAYEPLTVDQLRNALPDVSPYMRHSGVYFLWGDAGRLVYIGQSRDVGKRIAMHLKKPPAPFHRATYIKVQHPWQLAIERVYIDKYLGEALDPASGICLANCQ